jgi:hypothetical protein
VEKEPSKKTVGIRAAGIKLKFKPEEKNGNPAPGRTTIGWREKKFNLFLEN